MESKYGGVENITEEQLARILTPEEFAARLVRQYAVYSKSIVELMKEGIIDAEVQTQGR